MLCCRFIRALNNSRSAPFADLDKVGSPLLSSTLFLPGQPIPCNHTLLNGSPNFFQVTPGPSKGAILLHLPLKFPSRIALTISSVAKDGISAN